MPDRLETRSRDVRIEEQPKVIVIDPMVAFGRPVIEGTGVPASLGLVDRTEAFP